MITTINSTANSLYKTVKKLGTAQGRKKNGLFVLEGFRSVLDAIDHGAEIEAVIYKEGTDIKTEQYNIKTYIFSEKLFDELAFTVNSQGIIGIVKSRSKNQIQLAENIDNYKTIVYLDGVQDPGNLGTIVRSSDALGADALVLGAGCTDLYNPKTVRSTMSSLFNIPIFFDEDYLNTFSMFKSKGFKVYGTFLDSSVFICDADFSGKCVFVMGNEGNGISENIGNECDHRIKIPMQGGAESLNVATATSIILYEKIRENQSK